MTLIPNLLCSVRAVVHSGEGAPLPAACCLQPGAGRTAVSSAMGPAPSVHKKKGGEGKRRKKSWSLNMSDRTFPEIATCALTLSCSWESGVLFFLPRSSLLLRLGTRAPRQDFGGPFLPAAVRRLQLQLNLFHFLVRQGRRRDGARPRPARAPRRPREGSAPAAGARHQEAEAPPAESFPGAKSCGSGREAAVGAGRGRAGHPPCETPRQSQVSRGRAGRRRGASGWGRGGSG